MMSSEPSPIIFSSPDAGNRSAGEAIRRAREAQGMTLEMLAAVIKVTPVKLEALEQGRFDLLPDANFARALAMTICRALKMDPAEVLAGLPAAKTLPLGSGKPPLNQPFKEARVGAPLFDKQLNWSGLLSAKYLAPLVLLLGAVLIYALPDSIVMPDWLHRFSTVAQPTPASSAGASSVVQAAPSAPAVQAPSASDAASGVVSLVLDSADNTASAVSAAASAAPAYIDPRLSQFSATSTMAPVTVPLAAPPSLTLDATASSWVEVKDANGAKLLSRHLRSGESVTLEGTPPLQLRIGNAPGVQLHYKGEAFDLTPYTRSNVAHVELK